MISLLRHHATRVLLPVVVVIASVASLTLAGPATATTYEATFAVQDAGVWGPGSGGSISNGSGLIDFSWLEGPETVGDVATWNLPLDLGSADFGGSITGETSGGINVGVKYDVQGGKLDITYPAAVEVTYPQPSSFYPGDTITIATGQSDRPGRAFNYDAGAQDLEVHAKLGVHAAVSGSACVFDCTDTFDIIPPFDLPAVDETILDLHADPEFYGVIRETTWEEEFVTGIKAKVQSPKPDVTLDDSSIGRMFSTGTQSLIDSEYDVDSLSKYPWGQDTPPSFTYGSASYDIIDGKIHVDADQGHDFDFRPRVKVRFDFPRALQWSERTPGGAQVAFGTGTHARISAGNRLRLVIPTDLTGPFELTPTISIDNTLTHRFTHTYATRGEVKVLQASASLPKTTLFPGTPEWCDPIFGICIPSIAEIAVGPWAIELGPLVEKTLPIASVKPSLFDSTWPVTGFGDKVQANQGFDPENIPVADAGGPYGVAEGESIQLDATASFDLDEEALTYAWTLDAAGALEGTGSTPRFDAQDGAHTYTATVRACDPSGDCSEDTATIAVSNVSPELTLDTASAVAFGGGTAFLERVGVTTTYAVSATDPGTDDSTYTFAAGAFATWSAAVQPFYNNGATADAAFSPAGTLPWRTATTSTARFSRPGVFELGVDAADDDGGSDRVTAAVLIADASTTRRPIGWFKDMYTYSVPLTATQRSGYIAFVSAGSRVFNEQVAATTDLQAKQVLSPGSSARSNATAHLYAAWLNVASGAVSYRSTLPTKLQTPTRRTVAAAIEEIERTVLKANAKDSDLHAARQLAQALYQA